MSGFVQGKVSFDFMNTDPELSLRQFYFKCLDYLDPFTSWSTARGQLIYSVDGRQVYLTSEVNREESESWWFRLFVALRQGLEDDEPTRIVNLRVEICV